jgi:branched-chain amino acid transport system ATP-binding protein
MMGPLLTLEGVVAGYGQSTVLKGVDLVLSAGQVTCLIGPNGAGKSTVLKTVSGLLRPREGSVWFQDAEIDDLSPKDRLRLGIVHVPQDRSLFPAMSVWENVQMGAHLIRDRGVIRKRLEAVAATFPIVGQRRHEAAGSLSGGEQKIVELARTLMLEPTLILLDEPSIGLDPKARKMVFESVRGLAAGGRTVLLVEQNARSGLAAADRGAVLEGGVVCIEGTGAALLDDPEVARLYLGASASQAHGRLTGIVSDASARGDQIR